MPSPLQDTRTPSTVSSFTDLGEVSTVCCVSADADHQEANQSDKPSIPQNITSTTHAEAALDVEKQIHVAVSTEGEPRQREFFNKLRKFLLIPLLCSAQFFDSFVSSGALIALPEIGDDIEFTPSSLQWVVAAYTLTFASFQLLGGRLSDIYHPKPVFIAGYLIIGIFSILCAVSVHPIMLIVFRAVQGAGAAFTLPSAIALIVQSLPDAKEQGLALAMFAAFGAIGNSFGFVIGGVLTSDVSWKWVFYLVAILVLPLCAVSALALPSYSANKGARTRSLDIPGVGALTGGLILFVYAISDANHVGWGKPQIIVTLVFSVVFIVAFFIIESRATDPAVPPSTWRIPNIIPLFIYSLSIYWYVTSALLQLVQVFQDLFGWSALSAALHYIPIGVTGGITSFTMGKYGPRLPRRVLLFGGQLCLVISSVLYALADRPEKYWSHILPGMIIGMVGIGIAYVGVNVAIMASARKGEEGVVGALMNTAFQLGATVGVAILTAITLGVNKKQPSDPLSQFKGYEDSLWSLVGLHGLMMVVAIWIR